MARSIRKGPFIDDHLMKITHVLRGQEWLPSAPLHQMIYDALGWEPPIFVHMSVILDPSGKGKMSKRKTKGPGGREYLVLVKDFVAAGYLPDALANFIARLGWSYDDHTELFSRDELVEKFSLDGVNVSPARFDYDKLEWMNGVYIREMEADQFVGSVSPPGGDLNDPVVQSTLRV